MTLRCRLSRTQRHGLQSHSAAWIAAPYPPPGRDRRIASTVPDVAVCVSDTAKGGVPGARRTAESRAPRESAVSAGLRFARRHPAMRSPLAMCPRWPGSRSGTPSSGARPDQLGDPARGWVTQSCAPSEPCAPTCACASGSTVGRRSSSKMHSAPSRRGLSCGANPSRQHVQTPGRTPDT